MISGNWCDFVGYIFGFIESLGQSLRLGLYKDLCFDKVIFLFLFVIDKKGESSGLLSLGEHGAQHQEDQHKPVDTYLHHLSIKYKHQTY